MVVLKQKRSQSEQNSGASYSTNLNISQPAYPQDKETDRREHNHARISRRYVKTPDQRKPQSHHGTYHTYHLYLSPTPRKNKLACFTTKGDLTYCIVNNRYLE